ncbi:hypothetical protein ACFL6C_03875 [Myxococcota bacterium]
MATPRFLATLSVGVASSLTCNSTGLFGLSGESCRGQGSCAPGAVCLNGTCVPVCRSDADCPTGNIHRGDATGASGDSSGDAAGTSGDSRGDAVGDTSPEGDRERCSDHLTDPNIRTITYEDVAPAGYVLEDNYGGLGVDHDGWVYHCVDGYYQTVGIEDTAVFRYNSNTDEQQFLGTLREISQAEGNLEPGEEIAKIHAPVLEFNGMMYFGSHSFHDSLERHRGGHFYSYDLATGGWTDLSKNDPDGVSAPGQGILTMDVLRNHNKLVGFTYPKGEVITYDLATNRTTNHGRPVSYDPWNIGRHIIATDSGRVYFAYAEYDTPLYAFNITLEEFSNTGFNVHYGWLAGSTMNAVGTTAYFVDWLGYLYSINTDSGVISEVGTIPSTAHAGYSVSWIHGLVLSNDETTLYTMPRFNINGNHSSYLYEYEIATGEKRYSAETAEYLVGGAIDNKGNVYYHCHNHHTHVVKLLKLESRCTGLP